jgi:2-polyprenyl-6-hydroxyphenyl methylase/3-demethylubiquinone-9 3-methyltransferase
MPTHFEPKQNWLAAQSQFCYIPRTLINRESAMTNADPIEIEKFSQLAHRWWDANSEFKPLHEINPLRLNYINRIVSISGKTVLDVGCGGGILSESMAGLGAQVTGIDLGEKPLQVAKLHLLESGKQVDYRKIAVEAFAAERPASFDVVTCMEMLEHVPDPQSVVRACSQLVKPGGHVFFSTLNRNPKSYLLSIIGAEYVLNMLPRGTHDYAKFIKPSELAQFCRNSGLSISDLTGMSYNPLNKVYSLGKDTDVNYMVACRRD